jgi:hypothetical protein
VIGDAPCCVLPDGTLLLGSINTTATALYDPRTYTWKAGPRKNDVSSEETWTLAPDETVLTVECTNHPSAEKYVAAATTWVSAGNTPVDLVQASSIEIGPALLLPDGRVFAIGATGRTALYTPPPIANQPGTWAPGPSFPLDATSKLMEAKDAPACLLPNGKVLCAAGAAGEGRSYPGPTQFFEFDGSALNKVANPGNASGPPYVGRILLLTGQVLFAVGSTDIVVYTPNGGPDLEWAPQITQCPSYLRVKQTYPLRGRHLNGLSQAVSYGDDASMATNYPLVRITNLIGGKVHYCRTFDHSSMGVATGTSIQSTSFKVPLGVEQGPAELCVIAHGIPSRSVPVVVGPFLLHFPISGELVGHLVGSLAEGPLWALGPERTRADRPTQCRACPAGAEHLQLGPRPAQATATARDRAASGRPAIGRGLRAGAPERHRRAQVARQETRVGVRRSSGGSPCAGAVTLGSPLVCGSDRPG